MAISTTFQPVSIPSLSGTRTIQFNYPFFASSDLQVYVNGVLQTIGANYTVAGGNGSTGTVTLNEANAGGPNLPCSVVIDLNIPNTQEANFTAGGPLPGLTLNLLFDRLTLLIQQLSARVSRVLRFTVTSPAQNELALNAPGVVGSLNGVSVAMLTGTQLAELINLQGSQVNRPTRTFTDSSARAIAVPDFVGQLGIQLDQSGTESLYRSTGTTAGSWANIGTQIASSIAVGAVGTPQIAIGAVNQDRILDGSVGQAKIASGAVDAARIANKTITADQIADGVLTGALVNGKAFGTAQIATGAITSNELATNAVTMLKIADGSVSTSKIENGAVTQSRIAIGAVGSDQIADSSVIASKLSGISFGIAQMSYLTTGTNVAYTPLPGVKSLLIECIGGGGGSGRCVNTGAGQVCVSKSGGSGGYSRTLHAIQPNQTFKYTVGSGGAGGSAGVDGAAGGFSSFTGTINAVDTVLCRANGGFGGANGSLINLSSGVPFVQTGTAGASTEAIAALSVLAAVGNFKLAGNEGETSMFVGSSTEGILGRGGKPPILGTGIYVLTSNNIQGYGNGGDSVGVSQNKSGSLGNVGRGGLIIVTEFY